MTDYSGPERRIDGINRREWDGVTRWVKDIDDTLQDHTKAEVRMEERISTIETDLKEVKDDVKSILDMVSRAKGAWAFMGWIAGAAATLAAMWVWGKDHLK
jgi:hypothetical protein